MSIAIPVRDENGAIYELPISFDQDIPSGDEILQILKNEDVSLQYWIQVGLEYYRHGYYREFVDILEHAGSCASLDYADVESDQTKALDMLAAYFVRMANKERVNKDGKKELFNKATKLYTAADKLRMYDPTHLTGRAYFCLIEGRAGKLEQSAQQFNFVLKQNPNDIASMMGMAIISFNKKDYKTSLYYFKKCLKQKPNGPADFRVGIGYCLARMGKPQLAKFAFERALEIDPRNTSALIALGILDYNEQTEDSIQASLNNFGIAYSLEPDNPVVLVHLANHFFFRQEYDRTRQLAWHAMQVAENDHIKAEASYQMARYFHKKEEYDRAFKFYYQATTLNHTSFILPYYGLGQLFIQRGEFKSAIAAFEAILKVMPNNVETLKVVGSLLAHSEPENKENIKRAQEVFGKVLAAHPDDIEVLIDLAQLLECSSPKNSLAHYNQACELMRSTDIDVPAEILNNMGSLNMNMGNYDEARRFFQEAENKFMEDVLEDDSYSSMLITVRYNTARCLEHLCLFDDAERLYHEILRDRSDYTDCYIRLGCLARDRGQIYVASVKYKEVINVDQSNTDAWTLIGNLHMAKHEWQPAQKKFEHILRLNEGNRNPDPYAQVALGNIWLESLFNPSRDRQNDAKYIDRALSLYTKALKTQPRNMWATNGIGCILAYKKHWMEARDIFTQVREATADFFDVWINIAHVYVETRQYVPAIQMYTNAIKKFEKENDPQLLQYLARAQYLAGNYQESRETLERAQKLAMDNIQLKFNYAFLLKKMAKRILEDMKATTAMVNGAMDDLRTAERILNFISNNKDDGLQSARYVSRTASGTLARECSDFLKQAQSYLSRAQRQDEEEEKLRRKQEDERKALLALIEEENRLKEEEKRRKEEEQFMLRQSFKEMTKDCLKMPEIVEEKKSRGGGRRRKGGDGDEFVNDSSDMGDYQGEDGEARPQGERKKKDKSSKKAARKRRERKTAGSGSDDEEDRAERRRKKEVAAAKKAEAKLSAKQSQKIKSRAYLSSSDDSSDGPPVAQPDLDDDQDDLPPAIPSSDSDESEPKMRKKKPGFSDSSNSDEDERPTLGQVASDSDERGSEPENSPKKRKRLVSSDPDTD